MKIRQKLFHTKLLQNSRGCSKFFILKSEKLTSFQNFKDTHSNTPPLSAFQFALQTAAIKALEWESVVANAKSFCMPASIGNDDELSKLMGDPRGLRDVDP